MEVSLISITRPLIPNAFGGNMSVEDLIVYIARVSNPSNQMNTETSDKLISYLVRNQHWSPFSMVDATFEIKTSRAIAAQILRHKSFDFQEFSQRYAEVTEMEPVQIRRQGATNRQSSEEEFNPVVLGAGEVVVHADEVVADLLYKAQFTYKCLIAAGVAKECARMILPLTTQTTIYMKGSLRSWITYLNVRLDEHAQMEHREVAREIAEILIEEFPMLGKAFNNFNNFKGMFI